MNTPNAASVAALRHVIQWLENGCDPMQAAKELRLISERAALSAPQAAPIDQEIHEAKCPALDGGDCACVDGAVRKAWDRFQAALEESEPLPRPSIHAAAHYGAWLGRESHKHNEPKAGAFRNAARMLGVLEAEVRRLHSELVAAAPSAPHRSDREQAENATLQAAWRIADEASRELIEGHGMRVDHVTISLDADEIASAPALEEAIDYLENRGLATRMDAPDEVLVIMNEDDA